MVAVNDGLGRTITDGKQMRHAKFGLDDVIDTALCTALIKEALQLD